MTKVAPENEPLLNNEDKKNIKENKLNQSFQEEENHHHEEINTDNTDKQPNYLLEYLIHSKFQFIFLIYNIIFFYLFKKNIHSETNYPEGVDKCFNLRLWSSFVALAYFFGIIMRLGYLILMGIVIYYKKKANEEKREKNLDPKNHQDFTKQRIKWNLWYKYLFEINDQILLSIIVIEIFLLVGITIAKDHDEPCGNLRSLAITWIYIYNFLFIVFPLTMLVMCLYPYAIACKIFENFLKYYNLQLDIFDNQDEKKTS